jgi:hypothetical protein
VEPASGIGKEAVPLEEVISFTKVSVSVVLFMY